MVGKILIDTNVLLDYLLEREPFFEDTKKVILSCTEGNTKEEIQKAVLQHTKYLICSSY